MTKRFIDEGQHAGAITLIARGGKLVDFQACGYRDLEKKLRAITRVLRRCC